MDIQDEMVLRNKIVTRNIIETNWIHEFASIKKRLVSLTALAALLNEKKHLRVERQWRWKTKTYYEKINLRI